MKRLLLDTHAFLWFIFKDPQLSATAREAISDGDATIHLSTASLWEITIKQQIGRLGLGMPLEQFFQRFIESRQVTLVPLELPCLLAYGALPLHHRDPFDRLLIAQAVVHRLVIVTADRQFDSYDVQRLW